MSGMGKGQGETPAYIVTLADIAATDPSQVGAKAANLAKLTEAGFPVPEGVVLTTAAFAEFASGAALPEAVALALGNALALFGDQPLAVRSSGVAEDLEGASFAGQYETVLGVRGVPAVLEAIQTCWASANSRRVSAYQSSREAGKGAMAVLIQPLVAAEMAGVAFTANPITGDRAETLVSAVNGLGERLVSGEASPDEWRVKEGRATCQSAPEGAVTDEHVLQVAELARRVEAHFGAPQDIEWAWSEDRLYLLQARPITTLPDPAPTPVPVPANSSEGFWEREASHYPLPLTPLARTHFLPNVTHALRNAMAEFSLLLEGLDHVEIGGWVYARLVPPGGKDRTPPPDWLAPILFKLVPPLRARIRSNVEAVRSDKGGRLIERWHTEWRSLLTKRNSDLGAVNLATLSDGDLLAHIRSLRQNFREGLEIHMLLNTAVQFMLAEFFMGCRDLLGWDEGRSMELLGGLSETSSAPAHAMAALAERARPNPRLRQLLAASGARTADLLAEADPAFAEAFTGYVQQWARRAITYDLSDPTLAERPDLLLRLIHDQVVREYNADADAAALVARRVKAAAEARAQLSGRPAVDRERFDRLLSRAERAYPVREEHGFFDCSTPIALARSAYLEAGRRLADRSRTNRKTDIFFLEADEVEAALQDSQPYQRVVERRKGERAWVLANPGPASYGKRPGVPSFAGLPPESRGMHEAVMWTVERTFAPAQSNRKQTDGSALSGIAASAGEYTGPVRVIRDETEFHKIQPGDVLVCPITSPVWSILFASVGALVTDTGGILSHSAIIAREYRVPAVVATGNGTELLRDGQIVTVNGSTGKVVAALAASATA
jgi:phosphohistidine swiveling domain-containing protein